MFSRSEDVEVHALFKRGWSISAIARHVERDRKTVRSYLNGDRQPGVRRPAAPDPLAPFVGYVTARFVDDPHLWASALFDEVVPLGYGCSYPSFARQLRVAGLRPHCEACSGVRGRETVEIDHPAGEEIQWIGRSDATRRGVPRVMAPDRSLPGTRTPCSATRSGEPSPGRVSRILVVADL